MKLKAFLLPIVALACLVSSALAFDSGPNAGKSPPTITDTQVHSLNVSYDKPMSGNVVSEFRTEDSSVLTIQDEPPTPPSPWSIATYFDFRTKENSLVVLRKIGPLKEPFGLKFNLDVEGFAGTNTSGDAVVGVAVSGTFPLAKNLDFKAGLGTTWQPGQTLKGAGVGLLLGFSYRF